MQQVNYKLIVVLVAVAVLFGTVGGALFGGVAGYYAASLAQANAPAPAPVAAPASPATPLVQAAPPMTTSNSGSVTLKEDSAVIDAVNKTKPAVVTVINNMQPQSGGRGFGRRGGGSIAPVASGSGVIIDQQGYIVTNNHVVDGEQSLQVI